jgi:outer membrane protein OmpA-like peptidoglycan-associated protein
MKLDKTSWIVISLALVLLSAGCASKKYVKTELEATEVRMDERMDGVETQVEENQVRIEEQGQEIAKLSRTSQEALDRAIAAGKLAEGSFVSETVMTDDQVRFANSDATLDSRATMALDAFAETVKSQDVSVFIEIQGHTDAVGDAGFNLQLGERRAESVRRYLSQYHGFALHRMSVISYGETEPIALNDTPEGRAQNRRVVMVVLK